jgi:beta-mannosidase
VDLAYPKPQYTATTVETDDGFRVEVTAATLLRDLTIFADRLDPAATTDGALVTLLPGERTTFDVRSGRPSDRDAPLNGPVLRTANDLISGERALSS